MALRAPTKVILNKKWNFQTSSPSSILCWPQDDDQPHLRPTLAWLSVRFLRAFNFRVTWKQKPSAIGLLDKEIKGCLDIIIGCWSSKNLKKWVAAAAASICLKCSWQPLWIPAWKITLMRLSLPGGSFAQRGQYSEHQLEGSWTSGGERTADSVETAERGNRELGIGWRWNWIHHRGERLLLIASLHLVERHFHDILLIFDYRDPRKWLHIWTAPNHNPLLINIIHHHRHDGEEGLSPAVLPLLDPPFAAADLILVPGTLRYIIVVIIFVRATMRITSLRSCSTSLMVIAGKVESGTGETAAEGRTLPPARLVPQQRPLAENRENDRDGRDVPFLPLRRRHSCPLRLARSAPMQRAGLTHTPDVPSELVQVLGVDVEGDGGKVEGEEVDGEDIEDTWRGQVGPHSPQWPCPPMWPPVLSVLVLKIPGSCFLIRIGICCFPTCTSNGPGGLHRLCNRSSRSPGRRTAIHMPGIQWS